MILEIQYQHVFKTNEQDENDPHKLKAIVYTTERDIETSWEATNLEPDFGERRSFYVWFDKIPASAKKGLEQIEPKPDIRFTQNGVEYRNHITLKVCTDKQVPEEALLAATKNSEMLAGYYNDWQADLRKNGYSGKENTAPFPFKIYREARDIIRLAELEMTEKQTTQAQKRESDPKEGKHKSTADDIQKAMRLLKKRLEDSKTPDWEIPTIKQYLKDKMGYCPEISPKTKLGKYWAILYSHRKKTSPKKWKEDMVIKARKELESDGVSFKFLL